MQPQATKTKTTIAFSVTINPPNYFFILSHPEVFTGERLPELPVGGNHIPRGGRPPVAAGHPERQRLAHEDGVGLPALPPVA